MCFALDLPAIEKRADAGFDLALFFRRFKE